MTAATSDETGLGAPQRRGVPLWESAAGEFTAWRGGDAAALDRLVRLLTPTLWQLARAYGLSREAAEDVVQSTWLALVRGAETVREPNAVMGWLGVAARREAWRVSRAAGREDTVEPDTLERTAPDGTGPEASVLADHSARRLWEHVAALSERCRRLLRVIAFEDRPDYASLSAELGMAVGSIGPTRGRCLDKLRALLADDPQWIAS
jgi:RNA polymerase sigma factor (sigma-70 family)